MRINQISADMAPKSKKSTVKAQIDENLKRVYDDALKEEVPSKFMDLIARLKASESAKDE